MSIHRIIREGRARLGLSRDEFSKRVGVTAGAVQQWEKEGGTAPKRKNQQAVADLLGITVAQLMGTTMSADDAGNSIPTSIGANRVPLLSAAKAVHYRESIDGIKPDDGTIHLLTAQDVSRYTFALEIKGLDMTPDYKPGDQVIIDPDITPDPGECVAALNSRKEVVFRKYRPRGPSASAKEVFELAPINEDYPTLRSDLTELQLIGTLIEHRKFPRRRTRPDAD